MGADKYVIGVDVGTGSARAAVFDLNGRMRASAVEPIQMWRPKPDYAEQSSDDIWRAVCKVTRQCRKEAEIAPESAVGISFDATCSLVALDANDGPVPVNDEGVADRNIIVWMDHRAITETEEINAGGYDVLRYVGGRLSPEMETPKLLWLKRNLTSAWSRAAKFLDLADFLTYRASGVFAGSLCTLVCKWTYLGHEHRWDRGYFRAIGIDDLFEGGKIVTNVLPMGTDLGPLSGVAAAELGLSTKCRVGVGIIDAHAGGLGLLGSVWEGRSERNLAELESGIALIGGTSNCHMAVSREPKFIDGIWGPYFGAMVPGMWLTEGGQSAAGAAIDHVIADHAHASHLAAEALQHSSSIYELLNSEVRRIQAEAGKGPEVTRDIHILPDFIGNRSPKADPHVRGTIDGLSLDESITSQAIRYYAAIQAVAYGTRDIIQEMNRAGYSIDKMYVTGGGTKNPLWVQEHADATGCTLVLPREPEAVLLGSAILAATAGGLYPDIYAAMQGMSGSGEVVTPRPETARYHTAKFEIFQNLYREQSARRRAMAEF